MSRDEIPEPWRGFLLELDALVAAQPQFGGNPVDLHCTRGFVVTMLYGFERTTNDLDIIEVLPPDLINPILKLADRASALAAKHKVYIDAHARVADLPCYYKGRLVQMYPGAFTHLRLWAPDPYDLALSKLERNADRDIEDVKHLAVRAKLDPVRLRERYLGELRPYLVGRVEKHDLTLKLWVEIVEELSEHD
jgi:hypothetical protein